VGTGVALGDGVFGAPVGTDVTGAVVGAAQAPRIRAKRLRIDIDLKVRILNLPSGLYIYISVSVI
jgi:hypothetical protein